MTTREKQRQQIDRYVIRRVLGTGAMGSVYAAWDPKLHREVALKVVPARLCAERKGRERFVREARAIAALRHPNIVEIYDYSGTDSKYLYLVIEKLDGEDLYGVMHRNGQMSETVAAAIGHELCLALQVAHDAGIIHRDLKPENVFVNASGRVVLTDFGIVKAISGNAAVDGYRESTDVIGTPGFMAPELMSGRSLGPPIDLFALGVLLYNVTTGVLPFDGPTPLDIFKAAARGAYQDPRKHNPNLDDAFCQVIAHCLQANPKKRPRSAEQVREALKCVLQSNGVTEVRDDLRDYATNPKQFMVREYQRTIDHLVRSIKVAAKDHDSETGQRCRRRLLMLDPFNDLLQDISGLTHVTSLAPTAPSRWQGLRRLARQCVQTLNRYAVSLKSWANRRIPQRQATLALGLLLLVALASMALHERRQRIARGWATWTPQHSTAVLPITVTPPPLAAPPTPEPKGSQTTEEPAAHFREDPESAQVDVRVAGGFASLFIDGRAYGQVWHRSVAVTPGHHTFEVMKHGIGCRRNIAVAIGERLTLRADPRRKQIYVQ